MHAHRNKGLNEQTRKAAAEAKEKKAIYDKKLAERTAA